MSKLHLLTPQALLIWPYRQGEASRVVEMEYEVGRCRLTDSKPVLKAPMVSALETIACYKVVSIVAFKFNLRRYNEVMRDMCEVGQCRLTPGWTLLDRVGFQHSNLTYDEALSKFAFN